MAIFRKEKTEQKEPDLVERLCEGDKGLYKAMSYSLSFRPIENKTYKGLLKKAEKLEEKNEDNDKIFYAFLDAGVLALYEKRYDSILNVFNIIRLMQRDMESKGELKNKSDAFKVDYSPILNNSNKAINIAEAYYNSISLDKSQAT